ncbi:MAG: 50S ribosomal protein L11 methyltransferase [Bacteroidales bacterium]|jgi:ribosomal protein L11 methyltransferase|nr:50S ribosomal protein L11 methyltransferase [Bacteroidales bacterium]
MDYIEFEFTLASATNSEILMALLAEMGFESFSEQEKSILGYIPENRFQKEVILPFLDDMVDRKQLQYHYKTVLSQNWNAIWESHYDPVIIEGKCMVRAPFHQSVPGMQYEIVIEPKMSFGTAHHETTNMMIRFLMKESLKGKRILDMGCGTGILAILASKMKALEVIAIDNDEWAFNNARDNMEKNKVHLVTVLQGEVQDIPGPSYDLIMANINRNVLIRDIPTYAKFLVPSGILLVSGFYEEDLQSLQLAAAPSGLHFVSSMVENKWTGAKFVK